MTVDEESVYEILGESLGQSLPRLEVEMLVADSRRARFRRTLTSSGAFGGCAAESPGDCPAVTAGQTLSFATSGAAGRVPAPQASRVRRVLGGVHSRQHGR